MRWSAIITRFLNFLEVFKLTFLELTLCSKGSQLAASLCYKVDLFVQRDDLCVFFSTRDCMLMLKHQLDVVQNTQSLCPSFTPPSTSSTDHCLLSSAGFRH